MGIRYIPPWARLFLALTFAGSVLAQPTVVRVTPVIDPRLPALSDTETARALDVAATMIRRSYAREVRFEVEPTQPLPAFFEQQWAKWCSPFELLPDERADFFEDDLKGFEQALFQECRRYGTLEQVRGLLDEDRRAGVNSHADVTRALLGQYKSRRAALLSLKDAGGDPIVTRKNFRMFSQGCWGSMFPAMEQADDVHLYLTNVFAVEDFLAQPAPHAVASSLAYGFMFPTTNRCQVAYFAMLHDDPRYLPPVVRGFPRDQRHVLIAYVIAHEIGTHLLMDRWDSYKPGDGLARPLIAVKEPREVLDYENWPAAPIETLRKIDRAEMRAGVFNYRLSVAIARKNQAAAEAIINAAIDEKIPDDLLQSLAERYNETKWD